MIAGTIGSEQRTQCLKTLLGAVLIIKVLLNGCGLRGCCIALCEDVSSVCGCAVNTCVGQVQVGHTFTNPSRAHMPLRGNEHP
ncbi:hypothetical protein [Leucobacter musarum]|uniref:hypothetical protein n=1 Tax=Leucobacter musarum TaxID=1930747 RepID=UPI0006A76F18|nr:hypothetical protein [Leucobacter musarum]